MKYIVSQATITNGYESNWDELFTCESREEAENVFKTAESNLSSEYATECMSRPKPHVTMKNVAFAVQLESYDELEDEYEVLDYAEYTYSDHVKEN